MYWTFYNPDHNMITYKYHYSLQHTQKYFKALVDAVIPRTPELAFEYGRIQYFGALDLYTDEYLIMSLNNYYIPLAESITDSLSRYIMMGYYSEWSGYGSTRLDTPNQRKLQFYPLSWKQVGYPGPSLGYRFVCEQ